MKWVATFVVVGFLALHHDLWNWKDKTLVFGVLPMGLAYHALYSIMASFLMLFLVRTVWPGHLETPELAEKAANMEGGH